MENVGYFMLSKIIITTNAWKHSLLRHESEAHMLAKMFGLNKYNLSNEFRKSRNKKVSGFEAYN